MSIPPRQGRRQLQGRGQQRWAAIERDAIERAAIERAAIERAAIEWAAIERAAIEWAAIERAAIERAETREVAIEWAAIEWAAIERVVLPNSIALSQRVQTQIRDYLDTHDGTNEKLFGFELGAAP